MTGLTETLVCIGNVHTLHTRTDTHTSVSATEVALLPVLVCGTPCHRTSDRR